MIPFVDVVYDGDDYEFEISLEPKDPCCFGFKVVYHNGSFLLLQNIESIDISCVPGMEYIENDEELYDREPFTVEVGNTEDIDKIADILRELGDHYLEEDVASIPLSLTAYMKVTSFNPVVYEVCYMDKERKQRTVEEEKLRKEAVQELLIYQGYISNIFWGCEKTQSSFFTSPFFTFKYIRERSYANGFFMGAVI